MPLFWSIWGVLSLAGTTAILGILVSFWLVMGDYVDPRWGVALGTCILVWAALSHLFKESVKRMWKGWTGKVPSEESSENN